MCKNVYTKEYKQQIAEINYSNNNKNKSLE